MFKIKTLMLAVVIFLALTATAQAQTSTAGQPADAEWQLILDRVNLLVDNHFENRDFNQGENANWNLTGFSVGIYKNGRTAYFNRGFHESERRNVSRRRPVTENSIFPIGSLSKPVSCIMLSYFSRINNPRTGRPYVNLNDPLNSYFKTKPFIDTDGTQIHPTLLQFAEHYSGAPREIGTGFPTLAQFRSQLENLTYAHKPGTAYEYSSGATVVTNVVASLYYGSDFPQKNVKDNLLPEQLFKPLGMDSTKVYGWTDPAMQDRLTLPHSFNGAAMNLESVPSGIRLGGASGSIASTAVDMMRLAAFILGDNVPAGTGVLQQAAAAGIAWRTGNRSVPAAALTPHASNAAKLGRWFGQLFGRPSNSGRYGTTLTHGGALGGHNSQMIICPDTKTAVVVLLNTSHPASGTLAEQIMDRVLNAIYPLNTGIASYTEARTKEDIPRPKTPFNDFDDRVASYSGANANVDIALTHDLTIELPIYSIRAPARAGVTLTIRSANPSRPVTLTRGTSGDLFTVPYGATLIFRDIIIDGGASGAYANNGGGTIVRVNSGSFIMNSGAVLRNNANNGSTSAVNGGGVVLDGSTATFTMNGGEIIGNTSGFEAGGVYVNSGSTFTMTGGKINGNTANNNPGGVYVRDSTFIMSGGEIIGNTSATISGVRVLRSTFTITGGVVVGNGSALTNVVNGTYNLNTASPNNAVIIAWNRPSGALNYTAGSNTNLTVSAGATATWANQGGVLGVSYRNGSNTGWLRLW